MNKNIGLILVSLYIILAIGLVLFFNNYTPLLNEKTSLQSSVDTLSGEKSRLEIEINNLITEKATLLNQISALEVNYQEYESTHTYSDTQYWNYVSDHLFTNEEYELASFDFYYVTSEQQYGVYELEDELSSLSWTVEYEENVFDCSEMSAFLEWHLENEGWNTIIVIGDSPFSDGEHAWLLVETTDGSYMPVESTIIDIVWWSDPNFDNYFVYDYDFENIIEALDHLETEFDWWL